MKIRWDDYVSNVEVLRRAGTDSNEATLPSIQLHWTWHMLRTENGCNSKQLLHGELKRRKRRVGGQKLRYKNIVKQHLKAADIDNWEELAVKTVHIYIQ